jgi:hypothetical protein
LRDVGLLGVRDPVRVAGSDVSVRALGTSAVLVLSVSDRSGRVAAAVANALALRVIRTRLGLSNGELESALAVLDRRLAGVDGRISGLDGRIDGLSVRAAQASGVVANGLRAQLDGLSRQRDFLAQQRSVLESERVSLLSSDALRPRPEVISRASVPAGADSSGLVTDVVLGLLLGLLVGVGLAGVLELLSPTVAGGEAVARLLGAPLLGKLGGRPERLADLGGPAGRLGLVARSARVERVGLLAAVPGLDVRGLAGRLQESRAAQGLRVRELDLSRPSSNGDAPQGLVLVSPSTIKRADLDAAGELLHTTTQPLLGLITYDPAPRPGAAKRSRGRVQKAEQGRALRAALAKARARGGRTPRTPAAPL